MPKVACPRHCGLRSRLSGCPRASEAADCAAFAFVGGVFVTLLMAVAALPPTPDEMEHAAEELIPTGAEVEGLGATRGHR